MRGRLLRYLIQHKPKYSIPSTSLTTESRYFLSNGSSPFSRVFSNFLQKDSKSVSGNSLTAATPIGSTGKRSWIVGQQYTAGSSVTSFSTGASEAAVSENAVGKKRSSLSGRQLLLAGSSLVVAGGVLSAGYYLYIPAGSDVPERTQPKEGSKSTPQPFLVPKIEGRNGENQGEERDEQGKEDLRAASEQLEPFSVVAEQDKESVERLENIVVEEKSGSDSSTEEWRNFEPSSAGEHHLDNDKEEVETEKLDIAKNSSDDFRSEIKELKEERVEEEGRESREGEGASEANREREATIEGAEIDELKLPEMLRQSLSPLDMYSGSMTEKTDVAREEDGGKGKMEEEERERRELRHLVDAIEMAKLRQAERDAEIFRERVEAIKRHYDAVVSLLRSKESLLSEMERVREREREEGEMRVEREREEGERRRKEAEQRKDLEAEQRENELRLIAEAESSALLSKNTFHHLKDMEDLKMKVLALQQAFLSHSEEIRRSDGAHKWALCAFSLANALETGTPLKLERERMEIFLREREDESEDEGEWAGFRELREISIAEGRGRQSEGEGGRSVQGRLTGVDVSLARAVFSSLPENVLQAGAISRLSLVSELDDVSNELRQLALIPAYVSKEDWISESDASMGNKGKGGERGSGREGGGVLTYALAKIAANLKLREDKPPSRPPLMDVLPSGERNIETLLCSIRQALLSAREEEIQGENDWSLLLSAADALERAVRNTQGEKRAREWGQRVRERVLGEMAREVMEASARAKVAELAGVELEQ